MIQSLARWVRHLGVFWWGIRLAALVLLAFFCVFRIWDPFPVEALRLRGFDLFQIMQPRSPSAEQTVIIDIDEKSLRDLGQWPWPRDLLASLVAKVHGAGARVIGFDILFAEPDRLSPASLAERLDHLPLAAVAMLRNLPANDRVFADAIGDASVVLGRATATEPPDDRAGPAIKPRPQPALIGGDPRPYLLRFPAILHNLPELENAAAGSGLFALGVERDNIVRRVPTIYRIGDRIYPSLVTEMLRVAAGQTTFAVRTNQAGVDSLIVGQNRFKTDQNGRIWVRYAPSTRERYISASDILAGRVPDRVFAGRMVLVGTSAAGLLDLKATPIARSMPGVEVHAQLLETITDGKILVRPNVALGIEFALLFITGILIIIFVPLLGAKWTFALGGLLVGPQFAGAWYAFTAEGMLIDVVYPAVGAVAVYLFLVAANYLQDEAEKRRIRVAFSRYLSPDLVDRLADAPEELRLGGEQKDMTLLFSDIHGFTGISENYEAVDLTNLVNAIFNPLTHAILDHDGTVDKYMGDSIMAFWNAPLDDPDHARHACLAALEMQRRIPLLNQDLAVEARTKGFTFKPVKLGIGINTGECCVGNMGSDLRFDYSVLGDTVNTAARLEGQTRPYRVHNIIGETTWLLVPDFAFLELDLVTVVGKTLPVRIFTLLGDADYALTQAFKDLQRKHDSMLAAYRTQSWADARALLDDCEALGRDATLFGLYDMYRARIDALEKDPPGADWNTVYEAQSKG